MVIYLHNFQDIVDSFVVNRKCQLHTHVMSVKRLGLCRMLDVVDICISMDLIARRYVRLLEHAHYFICYFCMVFAIMTQFHSQWAVYDQMT